MKSVAKHINPFWDGSWVNWSYASSHDKLRYYCSYIKIAESLRVFENYIEYMRINAAHR